MRVVWCMDGGSEAASCLPIYRWHPRTAAADSDNQWAVMTWLDGNSREWYMVVRMTSGGSKRPQCIRHPTNTDECYAFTTFLPPDNFDQDTARQAAQRVADKANQGNVAPRTISCGTEWDTVSRWAQQWMDDSYGLYTNQWCYQAVKALSKLLTGASTACLHALHMLGMLRRR